MATTLALPSALNIGNDDLKPLIRKAEARTVDKPPYEVLPTYKRFNYDEQYEVYPKYLASIGISEENAKTYIARYGQNQMKKLQQNLPGFKHRDLALYKAAWSFDALIHEHYKLRGLVGGLAEKGFAVGGCSWESLFAKNPKGNEKWKGSPAEASKIIKKVARFCQADIVGICNMDKRWVFRKYQDKDIVFEDVDQPYETETKQVIPEKCKWVIVMGHEQDPHIMRTTTSDGWSTGTSDAGVGLCYSRQSISATFVAEFIRNLGYVAIAHTNDTSLSIPFAVDAGLAEDGRSGLAITPEFGNQVRWSKVFTDLPLEPDSLEIFGVEEFCNVCFKCGRGCPGGAIPDGPKTTEPPWPEKHDGMYLSYSNPGVRKWYVHHGRCYKVWCDGGIACDVCQKVCPFNKAGEAWPHDISRWFIENLPALNSLWPWLDDALGYGTGIDPDEWWENHPVTWSHGTRRPRKALRPKHEP